ncbi:DUF2294 domain-containing protein [Bacillus sp. FJAT-29953]|nr:DUF2294 domain-containing protein [Bacillus sp. FJAT-29953]
MVATQEDLLSVSSSFSRIIKQGVGKGPETCYSVLKENRLYIYIRNFKTPAEEVLTDKKEYNLVMRYRSSVISALSNELMQEASQLLKISFDSFHQDWNFHTNSGILLLVDNTFNPDVKIDEEFERKLYQTVRMVGSQLHKIPYNLKVVKYTQNICAIESQESKLPLEYLLLEQGQTDLLLTHTIEIKKGYFKKKELFEKIFNRSIQDIFLMWDCNHNKSYLIFNFNKVYY